MFQEARIREVKGLAHSTQELRSVPSVTVFTLVLLAWLHRKPSLRRLGGTEQPLAMTGLGSILSKALPSL